MFFVTFLVGSLVIIWNLQVICFINYIINCSESVALQSTLDSFPFTQIYYPNSHQLTHKNQKLYSPYAQIFCVSISSVHLHEAGERSIVGLDFVLVALSEWGEVVFEPTFSTWWYVSHTSTLNHRFVEAPVTRNYKNVDLLNYI